MAKFLYYPTKPMVINQGFGSNSEYYARFLDEYGSPMLGHMGIDFFAPHATPLHAVCDGDAYYSEDSHGGDGINIISNIDGQLYLIINWHLCGKDDPNFKPLIPTDGTKVSVKAGDLIGYTDNSGAPFESTGDHLHLGLFPLNMNGNKLYSSNGYGGAIDPTPYFNGYFAKDAKTLVALYSALVDLLKTILRIKT